MSTSLNAFSRFNLYTCMSSWAKHFSRFAKMWFWLKILSENVQNLKSVTHMAVLSYLLSFKWL